MERIFLTSVGPRGARSGKEIYGADDPDDRIVVLSMRASELDTAVESLRLAAQVKNDRGQGIIDQAGELSPPSVHKQRLARLAALPHFQEAAAMTELAEEFEVIQHPDPEVSSSN